MDLSLVSMDDLKAEIFKRFDGVLIITERHEDQFEPVVECDFHGGCARAIGLSKVAENLCLKKIMDTFEE